MTAHHAKLADLYFLQSRKLLRDARKMRVAARRPGNRHAAAMRDLVADARACARSCRVKGRMLRRA